MMVACIIDKRHDTLSVISNGHNSGNGSWTGMSATCRFHHHFYPVTAFTNILGIGMKMTGPGYRDLYHGQWDHGAHAGITEPLLAADRGAKRYTWIAPSTLFNSFFPVPAGLWRCWKSECDSCCAPCEHQRHRPSRGRRAWPATSTIPRPVCRFFPPVHEC